MQILKLTSWPQGHKVWFLASEIVSVQHVEIPNMEIGQQAELSTMIATRQGTHAVKESAVRIVELWAEAIGAEIKEPSCIARFGES